jgi:hypothetical protein
MPIRILTLQVAALAAALVSPRFVRAEEGGASPHRGAEKGVFGLGLVVGEPTGVCAKFYLGDDTAIDGAIGYAPFRGGFHVHADFLWHPAVLETRETFVLPIYVGAGARFMREFGSRGAPDSYRIGARGVAGILFDFTHVPIDVFAELAAILDLKTEGDVIGFDINASAGVRYYF